jgi:hypothetical protein
MRGDGQFVPHRLGGKAYCHPWWDGVCEEVSAGAILATRADFGCVQWEATP